MKQENKNLLLKDLCARFPYRVVCQCDKIKAQGVLKEIGMNYNMCRLYDIFTDEYEDCFIFDCRPYLFPLSSITEEQEKELSRLGVSYCEYALHDDIRGLGIMVDEAYIFFEFCYKHHIDFLGLIEMGLANDANGLNIY